LSLGASPEYLALCDEYRRLVPGKLALVQRLSAQGAAGRVELIKELHTIAGSAGSFGLDELGDAARAAEDDLSPATLDKVIEELRKVKA
jgi:HPt (histidine-containing phosphotransfer) domain-containing protein